MKVLVTGSTGFIGRHLLSVLEQHNIEYVSLGRNDGFDTAQHKKIDLLETDDFIEIIKETRPTHLIHLAWYAEHGKYWDSPLNMDWMTTTKRLLEAFCQNGGQHALIAGSCAEYDWRYGYCIEDLTPTNPHTMYGIAKDATRRLSEQICIEHGTSLAWARIFFPYGAGEAPTRLVPSLFGVFRKIIPPFGVNADSYRDFLHVSDVANAIAICSIKQAKGTFNISSGVPITLESIVRAVASLCRQDATSVLSQNPIRKGDPKMLVGENEKLKDLGWKQAISIEQGLLDY